MKTVVMVLLAVLLLSPKPPPIWCGVCMSVLHPDGIATVEK